MMTCNIIKNKTELDNYIDKFDCDYQYRYYSLPESYPCIVKFHGDESSYTLSYVYVEDAIKLINVKNQQDYLEQDLFAEKDWRI